MLYSLGAWFIKVSIDRFKLSLGGTTIVDLVLWWDLLEKMEDRLVGLPVLVILIARANVV